MLRSRSRDGVLRIRPRLFHTTADDAVSRLQFDQSWLEFTVLADCMSKTGPSKRSSTTSRPRISSWTCARGSIHCNPPSRFVEMMTPTYWRPISELPRRCCVHSTRFAKCSQLLGLCQMMAYTISNVWVQVGRFLHTIKLGCPGAVIV